jgi:SAM-dependent methyltransferase
VVPSALERLVLLRLNLGPAPMLDVIGLLSFRTAVGAVELGVLDALETAPGSAAAVADRIAADRRGTELLLDALTQLGYVRQRRGRYELTRMSAKWLPLLRDGIPFARWMSEEWEHLEEVVRDPESWSDDKASWTEEKWRIFEKGMLAFARMSVREVVAKTGIRPSDERLLDLGGGPGLHAVELVRANPALTAVVFDAAEAEHVAAETISAAGLEDRVEFRAGDFWHDDLASHFDVVFVGNVVHGYAPDENRKLFQIALRALAPGGRIVVLDELPGRRFGKLGRLFASLMALNMFISPNTQTYPADEITTWMREAGFVGTRVRRLRRSPGLGLVAGTAPG